MLGKLLRINLSTSSASEEILDDAFYRKYLGGTGFIGYYLLKETPPGLDPLKPENKLIFATGPVTGTSMIASGRNGVGAKISPQRRYCLISGRRILGRRTQESWI